MTVLLTGVHLTPALELVKQLKKDDTKWKISYIGHHQTKNTHLKHSLSPLINSDHLFFIPCGKFNRHQFLNTIFGIPLTIIGIIKSYLIISQLKPNIVVSFGGYVSVPVVIAAWLKSIPSLTHEQTLTTGLSTKINSFFVNKIALSFPLKNTDLPPQKLVVTGNLLRTDILNRHTTANFKNLNSSPLPLLYITGGSQGSAIINQNIEKILPQIYSSFNIIHQVGTLDLDHYQQLQKRYPSYYAVEYVGPDDLGWIFKHAHLVISRSGANTCQELAALNKNCIVIPLPGSSHNEQLKNAHWLKNNTYACLIINQDRLTSQYLLKSIQKISRQKDKTKKTKLTQNKKLLDLIHDIV